MVAFANAARAFPFAPTPDNAQSAMAMSALKPRGIFGASLTPSPAPVTTASLAQMPNADAPPPYATPPYFPDHADAPMMAPASDNFDFNMSMANARVKQPGFFESGGLGQKILRGLGEVGLQYGASQGDPLAMAQIRDRFAERAMDRQRQLENDRRQAEQAEWINRQNWQLEHRPPPAPTEIERMAVAAGYQPGTPEYTALMRRGVENKVDPYRAIPYSGPEGEGLLFKRSSQLGGTSSGPPDSAIQYLQRNPNLAAEFDRKYGQGASSRYLKGGSTPSGSGSFPLYPPSR